MLYINRFPLLIAIQSNFTPTMKSKIYTLLTFFITIIFFGYWAIVFLFALPVNKPSGGLSKKVPGLVILYQNWSLFSPPADFDFRLYFILRDMDTKSKADTIEVLENISLQKQKKAPFNQREIITDHLLIWNIKKINVALLYKVEELKSAFPDSSENYYRTNAVRILLSNQSCSENITNLENYSRILYKNNKTSIYNKEQKIILASKSIQPFNQPSGKTFVPAEKIIFETLYAPVK